MVCRTPVSGELGPAGMRAPDSRLAVLPPSRRGALPPKNQPNGAAASKWNTKVRWDLTIEIDAHALTATGESLPNIDDTSTRA